MFDKKVPSPLIALLVVLSMLSACERIVVPAGPNMIFICLDAARADHCSCYGYPKPTTPEIGRIAEDGALFERHFSNSYKTELSLPQMFTGRYFSYMVHHYFPVAYWKSNDHPRQDDETELFTSILRTGGWHNTVVSAHLIITPQSRLGATFHDIVRPRKRHVSGFPYPTADLVVDEILKLFRKSDKKKVFIYVHMMDPHLPYSEKINSKIFEPPATRPPREGAFGLFGLPTYPPDVIKLTGNELADGKYIGYMKKNELEHLRALYDADLSLADRELGRLYRKLKEAGFFDNGVMIITSDHGEELGEAGLYGHSNTGADRVHHVPLVMVGKGVPRNKRVKALTSHVDLAPTIVDILDADIPGDIVMDGYSLTPLLNGGQPEREPVFYCAPNMIGVRDGEWAWIRYSEWGEEKLLDGRFFNVGDEQKDVASKNRKDIPAYYRELWNSRLGPLKERYLRLPYKRTKMPFFYSYGNIKMDPPGARKSFNDLMEWDFRTKKTDEIFSYALNKTWFVTEFGMSARGGKNAPPPITITFKLPSGKYHLFIEVPVNPPYRPPTKSFLYKIGDEEWKKAIVDKSEALEGISMVKLGDAEVGPEETLAIAFSMDKDAEWTSFGRLLFRPWGVRFPKIDENAARHLKQLKALGYLQ